jgi:hypothetical protein
MGRDNDIAITFPAISKGYVVIFIIVSGHVEVCCLLERMKHADSHVKLTVDVEGYRRIKDDAENKKL